MGYLANFMVYTFAMVGVIVFALLIFKHASPFGMNQKSKNLKVIDSLSLGQRKTLYIVSAGSQRFLIAGDIDRTSLISKLDINDNEFNLNTEENVNEKQKIANHKNTFSQQDFTAKAQRKFAQNQFELCSPKGTMIKSLSERIK